MGPRRPILNFLFQPILMVKGCEVLKTPLYLLTSFNIYSQVCTEENPYTPCNRSLFGVPLTPINNQENQDQNQVPSHPPKRIHIDQRPTEVDRPFLQAVTYGYRIYLWCLVH